MMNWFASAVRYIQRGSSAARLNASDPYRSRFGAIAVEMGYLSPRQLKEAIAEQVDDDLKGRPHRILGAILYQRGEMTLEQVETVLDALLKPKGGAQDGERVAFLGAAQALET